eukprot:6415160-Prymnesium_polylepis.1
MSAPPTAATCTTLQHVPLTDEQVEQFASLARAWPTLCQGDDYESFTGAPCADEPFDITRYESAATMMNAYAAFHAYSLAPENAGGVFRTLFYVPNQYGLGNRLRAMKSALLIAMLTGRVFFVDWEEPYPVQRLLQPAQIDWRLDALRATTDLDAHRAGADVLCLPFGNQNPRIGRANCNRGLSSLQSSDLRAVWAGRALEVHSFTDLNIYLATNPHYQPLLSRLAPECPKRM